MSSSSTKIFLLSSVTPLKQLLLGGKEAYHRGLGVPSTAKESASLGRHAIYALFLLPSVGFHGGLNEGFAENQIQRHYKHTVVYGKDTTFFFLISFFFFSKLESAHGIIFNTEISAIPREGSW